MRSCDGDTVSPSTRTPAPSTSGLVGRTSMPQRCTAKVMNNSPAAIVPTIPLRVGLPRSGRAMSSSMATPMAAPSTSAVGSATAMPWSRVNVEVLVPSRMSK